MESDASLIEDLLKQDQNAFREVIGKYQNAMLSLARSIAGSAIADEIVQESWLAIIKALPGFERRSSLKTWILRIVANEAKTRLRRENRYQSMDAVHEDSLAARFSADGHWSAPPVEWDPASLLDSQDLKLCLDRLMSALPSLQSAALKLKQQQGLAASDICNILDISASNLRVLLHRARIRLFQCVEHFQQTGECCE
jgi:RNA polymerase sigma-70 factor (ECF subfamily)